MKPLFTIIAICVSQLTYSQSIVNVSPSTVAPGTLTGTISFEGDLTSWNTGAGLSQIVLAGPSGTILPASQNVIDDTHAEATFLIPASAATGCYDVLAFDPIADTVELICGMTVSNAGGTTQSSTQSNAVTTSSNALQEATILEILLPTSEEHTLEFYNESGEKIKTIKTLGSQVVLKRKEFSIGVFSYDLSNSQGLVGQGQLVVE